MCLCACVCVVVVVLHTIIPVTWNPEYPGPRPRSSWGKNALTAWTTNYWHRLLLFTDFSLYTRLVHYVRSTLPCYGNSSVLWVFIFIIFFKFRFELSLTRDRLLTSAPAEAMSKWIIASPTKLNPARQRASSNSESFPPLLFISHSFINLFLFYFYFSQYNNSFKFHQQELNRGRICHPGRLFIKVLCFIRVGSHYRFTYEFWQKRHTFRIPII